MNIEGARNFSARGEWAEVAERTWQPGMQPGARTLGVPRGVAIADVLGSAVRTRGLWIEGPRGADEIASLAALARLTELHVWPADAAAIAAVVRLSKQLSLQRVALVRAPASLLGALEGFAAPELSVVVTTSGAASDGAGLCTLFALPLRHLRVQCRPPMPLPVEAARALAATGRVQELFAEGLGVTREVVATLARTPTLETLTLDQLGAPGVLRVEGAPRLRRLELVGTPLERLEVESLPALEHLSVFRASAMRLCDLPRLRLLSPPERHPIELELRRLPALEHVYGPRATPTRIELDEVPLLRAVDVDGEGLDAESRAALHRTGARLTLGRTEPAKHARFGEKRKLERKAWKNVRLGARGGHGVLIAARIADDAISAGRASELATACEVWAQKSGRHLAGIVPLDTTRDLADARIAPVLVGEVVGFVGAEQERAEIDVAAARRTLQRLATLDDTFWAEASGIVGTTSLSASTPALYLVATGPGARAMLRAGAKVVTWVDVDVVAWTALDLDAVSSGALTLEHPSPGA